MEEKRRKKRRVVKKMAEGTQQIPQLNVDGIIPKSPAKKIKKKKDNIFEKTAIIPELSNEPIKKFQQEEKKIDFEEVADKTVPLPTFKKQDLKSDFLITKIQECPMWVLLGIGMFLLLFFIWLLVEFVMTG